MNTMPKEPDISTNQTKASAAIWRWKEGQFAFAGLSARELTHQGLMRAGIMLVAAGIFYYLGHNTIAIILSVVALSICMMAYFSPLGIYKAFDQRTHSVVVSIASVIQWTVLVMVYFLFFAPFGKFFRQGNRGPIKLDYESKAETYWESPSQDLQRRDRQF